VNYLEICERFAQATEEKLRNRGQTEEDFCIEREKQENRFNKKRVKPVENDEIAWWHD
jgi:hypothetical protein